MRKLFSSKRRIAMAAGLLVVAIGASAAFAYWTANGTGNGDANTGTDNGVSIINVAFSGGPASNGTLYPAATVDVAYQIRNDSTNTAVNVDKVIADPAFGTAGNGIVVDATHAGNGCQSAWYSYAPTGALNAPDGVHLAKNPDAGYIYTAAAGAGTGKGGTVSMSDLPSTNQDACKGATVTLHLKVNNVAIGGV